MCQIWHLMQTDQWGRAQTILMYYQKDRLRRDMMNNGGCKVNGTSTGLKLGAWHTAGMPAGRPPLTVPVGL